MNDGGRPERESLAELVALHALGVLPPAEHTLVSSVLLQDEALRAEWLQVRATADLVGTTGQEPVDSSRSARMKERLMAAVRSDDPAGVATLGPRRAAARSWLWGAGLAAAAAIVFALTTTIQNLALRGDLATAQRHASALGDQLARDERGRLAERRVLTDLVAADARRFPVPQGDVVVRGDRVYLALRSLPALPRGRVYQAWTLPPGAKKMVPSVTFLPDRSGVAVVALPERAAQVAVVAVSIEPDGGSRQPTSQPAFVRPLS